MEWAAEIIFQSFRVRGECHEWMMSARNGKNEVTRLRSLCLIVECGKNILTFTFFLQLNFNFHLCQFGVHKRSSRHSCDLSIWKWILQNIIHHHQAAERLNLALFHFFSSLSLFSQINVNVVRVSSSHRFSCMKCLLWCFFFTNIRNNKFSKPRRSNQIWISSPHPGTMRWAEDLSDLH